VKLRTAQVHPVNHQISRPMLAERLAITCRVPGHQENMHSPAAAVATAPIVLSFIMPNACP
jgi:hypothetical protein